MLTRTLYVVMYAMVNFMDNLSAATKLPIPVVRALRKLGYDIRDARRRRRIPVAILAQRASISRTTLYKVERGDAAVAMGIYGSILFSLGMIERLSNIAEPSHDAIGRELEEEHLPKRIRLPGKKKSSPDATTGPK